MPERNTSPFSKLYAVFHQTSSEQMIQSPMLVFYYAKLVYLILFVCLHHTMQSNKNDLHGPFLRFGQVHMSHLQDGLVLEPSSPTPETWLELRAPFHDSTVEWIRVSQLSLPFSIFALVVEETEVEPVARQKT